ncbi:MAG: molybdopterin-dependent oxidoreductase, partial [Parabacteroides sp.]|nr:molybdopterin-dependent oxidoreductase [Parabacteroides sp.]
MTILIGGCGESTPDDYDYAQQTIVITGLLDEDITVSVEELMEMESITEKAEATRFNGEKVKINATGPTLNTLLKKYEKSQSDFATIRFTAKDQYSIAVPKEILENHEIILSYAESGRPLSEENQPIHIIVPGERAMYWVRMLKQIDFETDSASIISNKVVFLDNAIKTLPSVEYDDNSELEKAIKTTDMVEQYTNCTDVEKVYLVASDGLKKNETAENFLSAYIKYKGENSLKFLAPHFPQGMHINEILSINYGDTTFYSLQEGLKNITPQALNEYIGISFTDVLKEIHFANSKEYVFTSLE